MKVALVYDRINKWGGAERVLLALHKLFPQARLYTSIYDKANAPWADVFEVRTSFLQNIPLVLRKHELLAPLMPFAFESFNFDEFDLVISVTSEAAKGILTSPKTLHICYCLTPTRYLWSGYDEYFKNNSLKFLSKSLITKLRKWDLLASARPDIYIAISKEVQARIKRYYKRDSELVYPPATLENSKLEIRNSKQIQNTKYKIQNKDYFLVVSRLSRFTKYKRVDLAIAACTKLNLPLKIVGDGSWKEDLKKIAGSTIEFAGSISDTELIEYYKNCKALIFPGFEDLGLVMIEAQRFGKPVVAFGGGGAKEIVVEGKTGLFFASPTVNSLVETLQGFESYKFDPEDCIKNSQKFGFENFREKLLSVVNNFI